REDATFNPSRSASRYSSSEYSRWSSLKRHADASRIRPVGPPSGPSSTTPPWTAYLRRSPPVLAIPAELSQIAWKSVEITAAGTSPVTASSTSLVGGAGQFVSRNPCARNQRPG